MVFFPKQHLSEQNLNYNNHICLEYNIKIDICTMFMSQAFQTVAINVMKHNLYIMLLPIVLSHLFCIVTILQCQNFKL